MCMYACMYVYRVFVFEEEEEKENTVGDTV